MRKRIGRKLKKKIEVKRKERKDNKDKAEVNKRVIMIRHSLKRKNSKHGGAQRHMQLPSSCYHGSCLCAPINSFFKCLIIMHCLACVCAVWCRY